MNRKSLLLTFAFLTSFTLLALNKTQIIKSATTHLVISEVQIAGNLTTDDFVEIYNPTDNPIDLSGHRLVKRTASGTADTSLKSWNTETIIPAKSYYLWANSAGSWSAIPDSTTSGTLASNNGVALRLGSEDTGIVIDSVAWGTSTNAFVEGTVFVTNPGAGSSLERVGDDTDNNSTDFIVRTPSNPQNSQSTPISTPTATPSGTPTETPISSPTSTPTQTPTSTPTATSTATPTLSPSPTSVASPTSAATATPSQEPKHGRGRVLGRIGDFECSVEMRSKKIGFFKISYPRLFWGKRHHSRI